jgi:hypothetical protein
VNECIYCHEMFDPPAKAPDIDHCRFCYYSGKTKEERLGAFLKALREVHPVEIEHTGGGCFWVCARLENGHTVAFTAAYEDPETHRFEMDAVLPETAEGPWGACHYTTEDCDDVVKECAGMGIDESRAFLRSCVERAEVGTRVRFVRVVERYPHALIEVGETGTVVTVEQDKTIAVRLDRHHEGLGEWENEVQFYADSDCYHEYFLACSEVPA